MTTTTPQPPRTWTSFPGLPGDEGRCACPTFALDSDPLWPGPSRLMAAGRPTSQLVVRRPVCRPAQHWRCWCVSGVGFGQKVVLTYSCKHCLLVQVSTAASAADTSHATSSLPQLRWWQAHQSSVIGMQLLQHPPCLMSHALDGSMAVWDVLPHASRAALDVVTEGGTAVRSLLRAGAHVGPHLLRCSLFLYASRTMAHSTQSPGC